MRYQTAPCPARPRPRTVADYTFRTLPTGAGMIRSAPRTVNLCPTPVRAAARAVLQDDSLGCQRVPDPIGLLEVLVLASLEPLGDQIVDGGIVQTRRRRGR